MVFGEEASEGVIRGCHRRFSSEIVIRGCLSEVVIKGFHQRLSSEVVSRGGYQRLSSAVVIISCHHRLLVVVFHRVGSFCTGVNPLRLLKLSALGQNLPWRGKANLLKKILLMLNRLDANRDDDV